MSRELIYRDEAIKALGEEPPVWNDEYYEIAEREQWRSDVKAIEAVPSALPCPEGFDPEHLTEQDKKDILEALDWVKGTITEEVTSAQPERHICRECKWAKFYGNVDKNGNVESMWFCANWPGRTDEEGFCHEWESR